MLSRKLTPFLINLLGEYRYEGLNDNDLERGMSCMRVYRNKDGTWAAMPNWMGKDKPYATNYKN